APLQKGANLVLAPAAEYRFEVIWSPERRVGSELDVSAFLLAADGRADEFVFFNNPRSPRGAVRLIDGESDARSLLGMNPSLVPPEVARIALCITDYGKGSLAAGLDWIELRVTDDDDAVLALFRPETAGLTEAALILGEVYRHPSQPGQWMFCAVAQEFAGGLESLMQHFGLVKRLTRVQKMFNALLWGVIASGIAFMIVFVINEGVPPIEELVLIFVVSIVLWLGRTKRE
ncbi:MAG: hypothetical protein EOM24_24905, partial [Chloroflexia bacterium]|nr:hypothetical protein [Chloroflexia bacterium]